MHDYDPSNFISQIIKIVEKKNGLRMEHTVYVTVNARNLGSVYNFFV